MGAMEPSKELVDQLTEWVKFLFDTVVSGMDWGSGFLSTEEVVEVLAIAEFLGVIQEPPSDSQYDSVKDTVAKEFPELTLAYENLRTTDHGHRNLYQSVEYKRYNEKFAEVSTRLRVESEKRMHEQAHQLLLRKLPRAADLTPERWENET